MAVRREDEGTQGQPGRLVFLHIPKTGGTSLRALFRHWLPDEAMRFVDPPLAPDDLAELSDPASDLRLIAGHLYFGIDEQLGFCGEYITFLRDPVERIVSFWTHQVRREQSEFHELARGGMTLHDFVEGGYTHQTNNLMTRILIGTSVPGILDGSLGHITERHYLRLALRNVETRFRFVGFMEQFDQSVTAMAKALDWPVGEVASARLNVLNSAAATIDDATLRLIRRHNALDLRLYNTLFWQSAWLHPGASWKRRLRGLLGSSPPGVNAR